MASENSASRNRFHRKEFRESSNNNHRDRTRDKYDDRSRNSRVKRRARSRSRSRNRHDDSEFRKSRNESKDYNEKMKRRNDHPRRLDFSDANRKAEPSPEWGKRAFKEEKDKDPVEKEKPNFGLSGKLTEDANTVNGVVIKYVEPSDARKPKRRWRLYPFKGEKPLPVLYIHRQSAYLMGRDRKVADIPLDHPSCSKQHAALQYRLVPFKRDDGSSGKRVRPYLIDLESANGTFVNGVKLEARRYHELLEKDVMKFGFSSREYVVLHEQSKDDDFDDDDVTISNET